MTVLVDAARWRWRGAEWCHLVSDRSLEELHEFAAELGCRRVGFQGDHYDIDSITRGEAIELGATACDSRELVRRLRAAGLRVKPKSFVKWSLVDSGVGALERRGLPETVPLDRFTPIFDPGLAELRSKAMGWFHLARPNAAALVAHGTTLSVLDDGDFDRTLFDDGSVGGDGIFLRMDRRGRWSVECIDPPPKNQQ